MMHSRLMTMFALPALAGVLLAGAAETRLRTRLAGAAIEGLAPSGSAEFRARGSRTELRVQVEDVNLPAGASVTVAYLRNGVRFEAGSITITAAPVRGGELDLNSQDGAAVPALQKGDVVVIEGPGGTLLAGAL